MRVPRALEITVTAAGSPTRGRGGRRGPVASGPDPLAREAGRVECVGPMGEVADRREGVAAGLQDAVDLPVYVDARRVRKGVAARAQDEVRRPAQQLERVAVAPDRHLLAEDVEYRGPPGADEVVGQPVPDDVRDQQLVDGVQVRLAQR